ncbi:MAG TPA: class I SAM-dependent methyltransferase, partial [Phycisphaerae bacterium]|nr:class I SAM-dependent methyltransferase [Phycisphaerae bacterium]
LLPATPQGAGGLDFGCGPGPALAAMLSEAGRSVTLYDPFYAPDESVWSRTYDFIAAAEVLEHLHCPRTELDRLFAVLRPGGVLGVMTAFAPATAAEFRKWHYVRDPTHVCFYSREVLEYIASDRQATVLFPSANVALLTRSEEQTPSGAASRL